MNLLKISIAVIVLILSFVGKSHHESLKIGFLSDGLDETKLAFKFAIRKIQEDRSFRNLIGDIKKLKYGDVFKSYQLVCGMLENGAIGIVGPTSSESAIHVQNICDTKEIPLIETRIDGSSKHFINLHPTPTDLGRAYLDIIDAMNWRGFTILYEDVPWLPMADYLMTNYKKKFSVTLKQLHVTADGNYRARLLQVKQSLESNIVICSSIERLPEILKQAQQVGLLSDKHNVLITSLDMHTIDMEPYQYSGTNITGVQLIDPKSGYVKEIAEVFSRLYFNILSEEDRIDGYEHEFPPGLSAENIRVETALVFDAVIIYALIMNTNRGIRNTKIDCEDPESIFVNGTSIYNSIKTMIYKGLSGEIQFDQQGNRENFELGVLQLLSDGLKRVAVWNSSESVGLKIFRTDSDVIPLDNDIFKGKTLRILTVDENPPYAMRKETSQTLYGNDQYEGFGIELIDKLAIRLGFNYTFMLQEDRGYGNPINATHWDGMIGELMADRADLAITDLTVTSDRELAADFTMPFMDLGIQILYEKPKKANPELLSFMEPLSKGVWTCLALAILVVSISFFILGRMSPKEWDNPYPCIQEPTNLQNQFTLKNSMWFTIGAILQEGSDVAPKAPSTRIVASIWWFFTLIMISSYTANLASFLTVQKSSPTIGSVEDLLKMASEKNVAYGAKKRGSTLKFFELSDNPNYQKMYEYMMKNEKTVMVDSNDEGVAKAKQGGYAFLMESSTIEYIEQRHCEVTQVGNKLDQKGYGIAMKKGSPFRGPLDQIILQMQESGELTRMKIKWWREKRGGGACEGGESGGAPKLTFDHVKGIYIVLFMGCGFGTLMGIIQWLMNIRKTAKMLNIPFKELFKEELNFVLDFRKNVKPSYNRKNSSQCDTFNSGQPSNGISESRSRSNSTINDHHSHALRFSTKNIHRVYHKDDEDL